MIVPPNLKHRGPDAIAAWCAEQPNPRRALWLVRCGVLPPDERPMCRVEESAVLVGQDPKDRKRIEKLEKLARNLRPYISLAPVEYRDVRADRPSILFGGRPGVSDEASPGWDNCVRAMEDAVSMTDENFFP